MNRNRNFRGGKGGSRGGSEGDGGGRGEKNEGFYDRTVYGHYSLLLVLTLKFTGTALKCNTAAPARFLSSLLHGSLDLFGFGRKGDFKKRLCS